MTGCLAAVLLSAFQVAPLQPCGDDEAAAAIASFRRGLSATRDSAERVAAVETLGTRKHPDILKELISCLGKGDWDFRISAAGEIAGYPGDPKASGALLDAARTGASRRGGGRFAVTCLDAAGNVRHRPDGRKLPPFFKCRDLDVARAAVDACTALKSRETIGPLVLLLAELEAVRRPPPDEPGKYGGDGGDLRYVADRDRPASGGDDFLIRRGKALEGPVRSALARITGQNFHKAEDWTAWWCANRKTWKEPE